MMTADVSLQTLALFAALVAVLDATIVRAAKAALARLRHEPHWHDAALRALAVSVGAALGLLGIGVVALPWWVLVAIGAAVGSHTTVVVAIAKDVLLPWRRRT